MNFRTQVQIKGTDETSLNQDGSFSYSMAVANLNYLLNGSSPLYVVWIRPRNELRFTWARDEARRLNSVSPDWSTQNTVTLRFQSPLTVTDWPTVYNRVLNEGQINRETHDAISRMISAAAVTLSINLNSPSVTDSTQAEIFLREHGIASVSAGHARTVLDLARLLSQSQISAPQIQYAIGYAYYVTGDYFGARTPLSRAVSKRLQLSETDRFILDALLNACDHRLGQKSDEEFSRKRQELEQQAPQEIALQLRLDRLRCEHLQTQDSTRRAEILHELRATADQIQNSPIGEAAKFQGQLIRLYADSTEINFRLIHTLINLIPRGDIKEKQSSARLMRELTIAKEDLQRVGKRANELITTARSMQHPLLVADAITSYFIQLIMEFANVRIPLLAEGRPIPEMSDEICRAGIEQLDEAIRCYEFSGNTEGTVRSQLLKARWLDLCEQLPNAQTLAGDVLGLAEAMGYNHHIRAAQDMIAGRSEYRQLVDRFTNPPDYDDFLAEQSDQEIQRWALDMVRTLELPTERLAVVERECFSARAIVREKQNWCRHIELHQDQTHQLSPVTHYRTDPSRIALCLLHKYQSQIHSTDWAALITAFKGCYCEKCPNRAPK